MEARVREMVVEEVSRELEESRDSQLRLRTTLDECQTQLRSTMKELQRTNPELQSTQANLATTEEVLGVVRGRLQLKEEELSALQGRIAERAEQLLQLLDRRRGDYSRQVQEEVVSLSKSYDALLKTLPQELTKDDTMHYELAWQLRDFLNPHLLAFHPSLSTNHTSTPSPTSPSQPHTHHLMMSAEAQNNSQNISPHLPPSSLLSSSSSISSSSSSLAFKRYMNLFTDFIQRTRIGEFSTCPKVRVRLQRLQQWRHLFKELTLRPGGGLQIEECLLCEAVWLVQVVGERLGLPGDGVLLYGMGQGHSGPTSLRLWLLRSEMGATVQYDAAGLLGNLQLMGCPVQFVSLAGVQGGPTHLEQWEAATHGVMDRLKEGTVGQEVMGREEREESLDMVDLDPMTELNSPSSEGGDEGGRGRGTERWGMRRRRAAAFHLRALLSMLCGCWLGGYHGNQAAHYQHLNEVHTNTTHNDVI